MENPYYVPSTYVDTSEPFLGFPLGAVLLLIIIFSLSGIFCCCYHRDRLQSIHRSFSGDTDLEADTNESPSKPKPTYMSSKEKQSQSLPVLMPGDRIPKFIALPCPCEPPRPGKIIVEAEKPTKWPHIAVPLYQ